MIQNILKNLLIQIKRNWILVLIVIGLISFGALRLDMASSFTGSDFTLNNVEVVGNNIQLIHTTKTWINPKFSLISSKITEGTWSDHPPSTSQQFVSSMYSLNPICWYLTGFSSSKMVAHTDDSAGGSKHYNLVTTAYLSTHGWAGLDWSKAYKLTSLTCLESKFQSFGDLKSKSSITLTEDLNLLELNMTIDSNVRPFITIDSNLTKIYFDSNKLKIKLNKDDKIYLGFELISNSDISTPQLQNNIQLLGSYVSSKSIKDKGTPLSVLTTMQAKNPTQYKKSDNFLVDLFYNTGVVVYSVLFGWWL